MTTTTYAEFERSPNREPRVLILASVKHATLGNEKSLLLSTIPGYVPGLPDYFHGVLGKVPTLTYSSKEITGALPVPTYSDLELIVPDGYDLSTDQSGIYIDDIGSTWIIRDRNISMLFGGDDLPFSEYRWPLTNGTVKSLKKTDTGGVLGVLGPEREIYVKKMASNKITAAQWPNAGENIGKSKPICIGWVDNIKPLIVDQSGSPTYTTYLFNENSTYSFLAVYDDGVLLATPADYTDNGDGTFTHLYRTYTGQITCDVIGASGAVAPWATMITDVLQNYGGIIPGRIDAAAVAAADIALPYPVSYFVPEETLVMDVVSKLSQGIPAWWGFNQDDTFTMAEVLDPATATATHKISNSVSSESPVAFIDKDCSEEASGAVAFEINFDYFQNYTPTPIDRLKASLSLLQRMPFTVNWLSAPTVSDVAVLTNYPFALSLKKFARTWATVYASALAAKWLALEKVERRLTRTTVPMMDTYEIGDIPELTYATELEDGSTWYRHGYNAKKMLALNVIYDFNDYTIKLGLWS